MPFSGLESKRRQYISHTLNELSKLVIRNFAESMLKEILLSFPSLELNYIYFDYTFNKFRKDHTGMARIRETQRKGWQRRW